jgi:hypothetical protein
VSERAPLEYDAVSPRRSGTPRGMNPNNQGGRPLTPIITTTAFNLGWIMAERGKRAMIVDGDPQCNLTGTVLGFQGTGDFSEFYTKFPQANINSSLDPIFSNCSLRSER